MTKYNGNFPQSLTRLGAVIILAPHVVQILLAVALLLRPVHTGTALEWIEQTYSVTHELYAVWLTSWGLAGIVWNSLPRTKPLMLISGNILLTLPLLLLVTSTAYYTAVVDSNFLLTHSIVYIAYYINCISIQSSYIVFQSWRYYIEQNKE